MKRIWIIIGLIGICLIFNYSAFSQPRTTFPRNQPPPPRNEKARKLLDLLDLTPQQIRTIKLLNKEINLKRLELRRNVSLRKIALQKEIANDTPNREKIEEMFQEFKNSHNELEKFELELDLKISSVLTSEQKAKLRKLFSDIENKRNQ